MEPAQDNTAVIIVMTCKFPCLTIVLAAQKAWLASL